MSGIIPPPQGFGPFPATSIQTDAILTEQAQISYDTVKETMEIKGINNTLQVGQESYIFVKNVSGVTINEGEVCRIIGYNETDDALTIVKALADKIATAEVSGMATTTILDDETGLITSFGRVNNLNTTGFTEGEELFVSETVPGAFTATKPTAIPVQVGHMGKVDATKGFIQVEVRELSASIRGIFSDTTDQTYSANVSKPINFNTNDILQGITHDTVTDNEEITFDSAGVYNIIIEPQYTRTSGGGTDVLNMYIQKSTDGGTTFVNIIDSNIKVGVNTSGIQDVTTLTQTLKVNTDDKIRIMIQVESANLKLDAFATSGSGDNAIPATPSVIMNIFRVGD